MKATILTISLCALAFISRGQSQLLSYDDIKYILHNNLMRADTFLTAKGYQIIKKDNKDKNRKYVIDFKDGTASMLNIRSDGKKLFIEIETNRLEQYNLIHESVAQYVTKDNMGPGIQSFAIKELGNIYITINDTAPYNPLKKDYDIQVVADKNITAYN